MRGMILDNNKYTQFKIGDFVVKKHLGNNLELYKIGEIFPSGNLKLWSKNRFIVRENKNYRPATEQEMKVEQIKNMFEK